MIDESQNFPLPTKDNLFHSSLIASAVFDLEKVLSFPKSPEYLIFYKRRLSASNLTINELDTKGCICNFCDETRSRRGSPEVSSSFTCTYKNWKAAATKKSICLQMVVQARIKTPSLHPCCCISFGTATISTKWVYDSLKVVTVKAKETLRIVRYQRRRML